MCRFLSNTNVPQFINSTNRQIKEITYVYLLYVDVFIFTLLMFI